MSVPNTAGVSTVATILTTLAERDHCTVNELCAEHEIPRSTAFLVIEKLALAGFVTRYGKGFITLGPQAVRLGYASVGLAALAGPAEAALAWLRNETSAQVALMTSGQPPCRLVSIPDIAFESDMEVPVRDTQGRTLAAVQLQCAAGSTLANRNHALQCCERVAKTLESYLRQPEIKN